MEEIECKYFFEMANEEKTLAPRERAEKLVDEFKVHAYCGSEFEIHTQQERYHAIKIAILTVTLLLNSTPMSPTYKGENFEMHAEDYWKDVLQHLEKMLHE